VILLVHWNAEEAEERAARLRSAGFDAKAGPIHGTELMKAARTAPPEAIVIDLTRLPSHGREAAVGLRRLKATRLTPLVFVGGEPAKLERIRTLFPDATFTDWSKIRSGIRKALRNKPTEVEPPPSLMTSYAPKSLSGKLGIRAGTKVLLLNEPAGFERAIEPLPEGAEILEVGSRELAGLVLAFAASRNEMVQGFRNAVNRSQEKAGIWICWPKKSSGVASDLTERDVREYGLGLGWVDYKVCSVDATWSGLLFARRRT
jgi:hypothetical protein